MITTGDNLVHNGGDSCYKDINTFLVQPGGYWIELTWFCWWWLDQYLRCEILYLGLYNYRTFGRYFYSFGASRLDCTYWIITLMSAIFLMKKGKYPFSASSEPLLLEGNVVHLTLWTSSLVRSNSSFWSFTSFINAGKFRHLLPLINLVTVLCWMVNILSMHCKARPLRFLNLISVPLCLWCHSDGFCLNMGCRNGYCLDMGCRDDVKMG